MDNCKNNYKNNIKIIIKIIYKECFEIFGFDYILDSSYRTWLIEVNTNPCLEESS